MVFEKGGKLMYDDLILRLRDAALAHKDVFTRLSASTAVICLEGFAAATAPAWTAMWNRNFSVRMGKGRKADDN